MIIKAGNQTNYTISIINYHKDKGNNLIILYNNIIIKSLKINAIRLFFWFNLEVIFDIHGKQLKPKRRTGTAILDLIVIGRIKNSLHCRRPRRRNCNTSPSIPRTPFDFIYLPIYRSNTVSNIFAGNLIRYGGRKNITSNDNEIRPNMYHSLCRGNFLFPLDLSHPNYVGINLKNQFFVLLQLNKTFLSSSVWFLNCLRLNYNTI